MLLANHAIEGLSRLGRHPAGPGAENFLVDVDDLSDGRQFFSTDERNQRPQSDGGIAPVTLGRNGVPGPALRWSRRSVAMSGPNDDTVWTYASGVPTSGMVSPYVQPRGIHGRACYVKFLQGQARQRFQIRHAGADKEQLLQSRCAGEERYIR
mgnify:CR=1 FL=1